MLTGSSTESAAMVINRVSIIFGQVINRVGKNHRFWS